MRRRRLRYRLWYNTPAMRPTVSNRLVNGAAWGGSPYQARADQTQPGPYGHRATCTVSVHDPPTDAREPVALEPGYHAAVG